MTYKMICKIDEPSEQSYDSCKRFVFENKKYKEPLCYLIGKRKMGYRAWVLFDTLEIEQNTKDEQLESLISVRYKNAQANLARIIKANVD